jgi:ABC-type uncharacterized transport system auxiliary subunit
MRLAAIVLTTFLALLLPGCQSAPPVPVDKYFHLTVFHGPAAQRPTLNEALWVAPLRAEGPYAERAMLFANAAQPRELQQYHYQHWIEPPAILLQEHLRASLEMMAIAPRVTDVASGASVKYLLNGKILRLEKIIENGKAKAIVALRLTLQKKQPLDVIFEQNYSAEESLSDLSQSAYVVATEVALQRIYDKFGADIRTLN